MAEFDSLVIFNPTDKDFSWGYNGETYSIGAHERKAFMQAVAFHLAKHLSDTMIVGDALKTVNEAQLADHKNQIHAKISQLSVYDTHERRIALFKILNDTERVLDVIKSYPLKGFIGEMEVYRQFVQAQKPVKEPEEDKSDESEGSQGEGGDPTTPPARGGRPRNLERTIVGAKPNAG